MDLTALQQLHFIRPWLLLLLLPLALLLIWGRRRLWRQGAWSAVVDAPLLQLMLGSGGVGSRRRVRLLAIFWLLAVIALAGPTWRQLPQPVYQSQAARVILMDLSLSMDAGDVSPSRLTRAKHKLLDLLDKSRDGETGLVVYAGDAFVISPLTSDARTISAMVPPLSTRIMPALGSRPDLGLDKALELLRNAGRAHGEILWITDGATQAQLKAMAKSLQDSGYPLSILAIGTRQGAPIELQEGFLKDASGAIVIPRLDYDRLAKFARANNARLIRLAADNSDIDYLLTSDRGLPLDAATRADDLRADTWEDGGVWLALLLLPLALVGFRRGNSGLPVLLLLVGTGLTAPPVQAGLWQDLWLRPDQQGAQRFEDNPEQAAQLFNNPDWQGSAAYRAGDFEAAARAFAGQDTALSSYNRGNALARLGDYDQAIAAYEQALEKNPPFREDVEANLELIRSLKQQQEQQEQQQKDAGQQNPEQGESSSSQQNDGQDDSQEQDKAESGQQDQESGAEDQEQTGQAEPTGQPGEPDEQPTPQEQMDARESEEKDQELEQWLRRIPDDPGGLLRRKMYREYLKRRDESKEEKIW